MTTAYGDAHSREFWEAAARREYLVQRCTEGHHQSLPRPFCVTCGATVAWVAASGRGTVYSFTEVCVERAGLQHGFSEDFEPPYIVALVDLEEGPRVLTNILGGDCLIGDRVQVSWYDRGETLPPLPIFMVVGPGSEP